MSYVDWRLEFCNYYTKRNMTFWCSITLFCEYLWWYGHWSWPPCLVYNNIAISFPCTPALPFIVFTLSSRFLAYVSNCVHSAAFVIAHNWISGVKMFKICLRDHVEIKLSLIQEWPSSGSIIGFTSCCKYAWHLMYILAVYQYATTSQDHLILASLGIAVLSLNFINDNMSVNCLAKFNQYPGLPLSPKTYQLHMVGHHRIQFQCSFTS